MIDLDDKLAHIHRGKDLVDNLDTLSVGDHGVVLSRNVKVTLVELPGGSFRSEFSLHYHLNAKLGLYIPESSTLNAGIVTSVHFGDVVALDVGDLVHCTVTCKGNGQVIPK